jgi:hypothetical protein
MAKPFRKIINAVWLARSSLPSDHPEPTGGSARERGANAGHMWLHQVPAIAVQIQAHHHGAIRLLARFRDQFLRLFAAVPGSACGFCPRWLHLEPE